MICSGQLRGASAIAGFADCQAPYNPRPYAPRHVRARAGPRSVLTLVLCTLLHAFTHAYGTLLVPLYLLIVLT